ncbi:MAG: hypothetical protein CME32_00525 [Gimesia sp.]|jgi:hypothetical protein|nr:hypothetical protein [Gimesia sp.]
MYFIVTRIEHWSNLHSGETDSGGLVCFQSITVIAMIEIHLNDYLKLGRVTKMSNCNIPL